jgi:hypothetical protein
VLISKNRHRLLIAATALLALGACGKAGTDTGNSATGMMRGADGADPAQAKLDTYVEGYNKLIGTFGLTETTDTYERQKIEGKSPTDTISISTGWIDQAVTKLKAARALPGGPADLDKAGDALIAALDKVQARLAPLNTYYESKAYKEDNLARGKREDPLMRADFKAALASSEAFDVPLKRERHARVQTELAALKNKGNMLAYDTKLALQQAEELVDLFNTPEDVKNPQVIAHGDTLVAEIEKTLADQRTAFAAAKAKNPSDSPDLDYTSVERHLNTMVGNFRDLKQSHDPSGFKSLVESYNDAVESANSIRS